MAAVVIDRRRVRDWNVWATEDGDVVVDFYDDPSGWAKPVCGFVIAASGPAGAASLASQIRYKAVWADWKL